MVTSPVVAVLSSNHQSPRDRDRFGGHWLSTNAAGIYRYRWDGRVQGAKLNPYTEPPASSELAELRDPLWLRINYPAIRTIYGPLAQWLFRATYQLDSRLVAFQAMATLGDLLCIGFLFGCLSVGSCLSGVLLFTLGIH